MNQQERIKLIKQKKENIKELKTASINIRKKIKSEEKDIENLTESIINELTNGKR